MSNYYQGHKEFLDKILLSYPMVKAGKMFGYPAYYVGYHVGNKLAICHYEHGVGVKLPFDKAQQLLDQDPNVIPFQPHGRQKMRAWVQINLVDSQDFIQFQTVLEDSINYVFFVKQMKART